VKDFCNVYFDKIRGYQDPNDQRGVLQGLKFYLHDSDRNIGYANAFWSINSRYLSQGYRIFYGPAKEIVKCSDGYVISYNMPRRYYDTWQPVVAYLPSDVLEEFDWGPDMQRMLVQDQINKNPWVFLYGRHELADHGIVIPLESVYWLHCTQHPCWSNKYQVRVSEAPLPHEEVLPTLFDRRLREFQQKFSSESRMKDSGIDHAEAMPQQEPTISQPNLVRPHSLIETISSPALQHASPEQAFPPLDTPRSSPLPEPGATPNEKRWHRYRKAINFISRLWEKL
jgi:hypothetical protein